MGKISEKNGRCSLTAENVSVRTVRMTYKNRLEGFNTTYCSNENTCIYASQCIHSNLNRKLANEAYNPTIKE